jgi:AraC-like DNA-binding protein
MLSTRTVFERDGLRIADIACRHGRGNGTAEEATGYGVGFVRRGCFARSAEGTRALLDPSSIFFVNLSAEQRYDHPHTGGDDCTAFLLDAELLASLWGGDPRLPAGAAQSPPGLDLAHRQLLADATRADDTDEVFERAILLLTATLEGSSRPRVSSGRPATDRARRRLVEDAREALAANPSLPLPALATGLAVSPHHLSRIFRATTGHTVSRHRMRLRTRAALDRLAAGESNLARLAADLGFADHGHLCRVLREETGSTPSALRAALRSQPGLGTG